MLLLSPQTWPFSLEFLPKSAYLVGGAVRDALLLRRAEYLDLDFVLPENTLKIARSLANHYKAGFVVLDKQRQIARVVFDGATVDLAQQEGESLETDLYRRDFTINAIAYNPHTAQFFDPLNGVADCRAGIIRMVSPKNLEDDPLRLLRGYRQAAQLGFMIEPTTQSAIRQLAPLLEQVAVERVQVELGYLLKSPQGTPWLINAVKDNLLQSWFPDVTEGDLGQIIAVAEAAAILTEFYPNLGLELNTPISGKSLSLLSLAKLTNLLPSLTNAAEELLSHLTYSRAEMRVILTVIQYLPELLSCMTSLMSLRQEYFFFRNVGSVFPALAVMAIAKGMTLDELSFLIERYLNPKDPVAHPTPLVTGKDLMAALNLPPSPQLGQLLTEIHIAMIEGKIHSREDAFSLAAQIIAID
jgi:tRNA nucleotidyltransferase (CCA-adding enzyme)